MRILNFSRGHVTIAFLICIYYEGGMSSPSSNLIEGLHIELVFPPSKKDSLEIQKFEAFFID